MMNWIVPHWVVPGLAAVIAGLVCRRVARSAIRRAQPESMRTNVDGKLVAPVLGWGIVAGATGGIAIVLAGLLVDRVLFGDCLPSGMLLVCLVRSPDPQLVMVLPTVVIWGMFVAGYWDDRRGDERPRGFTGHFGALSGGAVTGGIVKLAVGVAVGLFSSLLLVGFTNPLLLVLIAAAIALSANLVNLLDRAPGRALKFFLAVAAPLWVFGGATWRIVAAGMVGAALAALPFDLRAAAILGDAGANPLGAMLGLGLAVHLAASTTAVTALVVVLLALNLASERWSFSALIAGNRWLARLDHLGRK